MAALLYIVCKIKFINLELPQELISMFGITAVMYALSRMRIVLLTHFTHTPTFLEFSHTRLQTCSCPVLFLAVPQCLHLIAVA